MSLAESANGQDAEERRRATERAYDDFVEEYHRLALDADKAMWVHLRRLESTLKEMLERAKNGDVIDCGRLKAEAAEHRRALEDSFRRRLEHEPLHDGPDPAEARRSPAQTP